MQWGTRKNKNIKRNFRSYGDALWILGVHYLLYRSQLSVDCDCVGFQMNKYNHNLYPGI